MIRFLPILIFVLCSSCKQSAREELNGTIIAANDRLVKIAFGSCNRQSLPNPFWPVIQKNQPDMWIWGGDNIYADTEDMNVLQTQYMIQKSQPAYASFEKEIALTGTWDDHDYGENDGGRHYGKRRESQQLFLDFLNVPEDDPRRTMDGIYHSKLIQAGDATLKILVLDTRFFRSDLKHDPSPNRRYMPDSSATATMLGKEQWKWLENELTNSTASFHIVVSSIQMLSSEHGYEGWYTMPREMSRFIDLLQKTKPSNCIVLSGDRHISEFSSLEIDGLDYPLIDFTSSGLTHPYVNFPGEPNRLRVGEVVSEKSFGLLTIDLDNNSVLMEMKSEANEVQESLMQIYD